MRLRFVNLLNLLAEAINYLLGFDSFTTSFVANRLQNFTQLGAQRSEIFDTGCDRKVVFELLTPFLRLLVIGCEVMQDVVQNIERFPEIGLAVAFRFPQAALVFQQDVFQAAVSAIDRLTPRLHMQVFADRIQLVEKIHKGFPTQNQTPNSGNVPAGQVQVISRGSLGDNSFARALRVEKFMQR